jgi:hypothetical protein
MSFSSFSNLLPSNDNDGNFEELQESHNNESLNGYDADTDNDDEEYDDDSDFEIELNPGQFALQYGIEDPIIGNVEDTRYSTLREAVAFYQERLGIMSTDLDRLSARQSTDSVNLDARLESGAIYTLSIGHNRKG